MTSRSPLLCEACVRFNGIGACTSFPDGIPDDILVWGGDHHRSRHGEPVFLLKPMGGEAYAEWSRYTGAPRDRAVIDSTD